MTFARPRSRTLLFSLRTAAGPTVRVVQCVLSTHCLPPGGRAPRRPLPFLPDPGLHRSVQMEGYAASGKAALIQGASVDLKIACSLAILRLNGTSGSRS